jgi:hypothetical protein
MATIRRYPVPPDSYNPEGPLNDLVREQLAHFTDVAERLRPRLQMPVPTGEDVAAANRFIAAVTERLMSMKQSHLKLVKKRARKSLSPGIAIAAQAKAVPPSSRGKQKTRSKSKPRSPGK